MSDSFKLSNIGNLEGLVAIVTGGGTGIGLMIAKGFAANGAAKVYITGRRVDVLQKVSAESGGTLIPLPMDVNDKESIARAVSFIEKNEGKLDILVNNAGSAGPISVLEEEMPSGKTYGDFLFNKETYQQWQDVLSTNTIAPFFVTTGFLALLEKGAQSRPGRTSSVINISSCIARMKLSGNMFAYAVTKVGIEHLTTTMAAEFARRRIPVRVNALVPGTFSSELTASEDVLKERSHIAYPGFISPTPVLRPGRSEEISMAAIYLASAGGGFSNGTFITIDGGMALVNP
ncbi:short-chain dehydrogenase [Mycena floridula]|nr:short-chain dehydrogenase [Mycena floridula]KAJ7593574.1 short-chain dehydrogenase [Mycena floridula]